MAASYGNTKIDRDNTQLDSRGDLVSLKPETVIIQDEENPIPDKYEGDITFNKVVYSLREFRDRVDLGFSELNSTRPTVDIRQFFNEYNELFFEIPKEGENSHTTLVQTSLDYLDNYVSPLQSIIDARDLEIQSLQEQILTLQTSIQEAEAEAEAEEIAEQTALAEYTARYGNDYTTNPRVSLTALKENLKTISRAAVEDLSIIGNNINKVEDEFNQAYNDVSGGSRRSYQEWKSAIEEVTGNNDQRAGCFIVLNDTRTNVASGVGEIAGLGPQL